MSMRDCGLARRKRGWSIAEVGKLRECFSLALVRVALRIGHFVFKWHGLYGSLTNDRIGIGHRAEKH